MGKGDAAREQGKALDIAKAKGKNKICGNKTSVVGLQKEGKKEGRVRGDKPTKAQTCYK